MTSFFGKMKNQGVKAKLQGECTLLDREMKARKHRFGVELYDLLREGEKKTTIMNTKTNKSAIGTFKQRIQEEWDMVRKDMADLEDKQESLKLEKTHEEVRRERGSPAITAKEKWQNAGNAVNSRAKETKLAAQIALLDRDMQKRKEKWGLEVFDKAVLAVNNKSAPTEGGKHKLSGGIKSGVSNVVRGAMMKVSEHEQKIQHCVESAAREVDTIERSKKTRLSEIEALSTAA